jgi:hypothetical protein
MDFNSRQKKIDNIMVNKEGKLFHIGKKISYKIIKKTTFS